jgi:uncharacterized protein
VEPTQVVDFVIVGYGHAGRAAAQTLLEKCPETRILVIDQHTLAPPISEKTHAHEHTMDSSSIGNGLLYLNGSVVKFNHSKQTVDVITSGVPDMQRIQYKHSMLIASGSRGAPPPSYLIDEKAAARILEMMSTKNPFVNQYVLNQNLGDGDTNVSAPTVFPLSFLTMSGNSQRSSTVFLETRKDPINFPFLLIKRFDCVLIFLFTFYIFFYFFIHILNKKSGKGKSIKPYKVEAYNKDACIQAAKQVIKTFSEKYN